MKRIFKAFVPFSMLIISLNTIARAQENKAATIDSLMHHANQLGLFNGNILVADHHKIVYKATMGFADAAQKTRLTEQYRFNIGSIAKEFNAVAIMMLKEQGKLSLDDKVSKYLTDFPAWANQITIKNLLQYTSGLPDIKWETVKKDADNLADLKKLDQLDFEPGSTYAYNNNNVFLQRRIIEKITGMSFNAYVEQKILKPSKMNMAIVDPTETDHLVAKSYNNAYKQDPVMSPISGWTAVNLADFYKWGQVIANFKLISPASTREIITPAWPNKQSGLGKGLMEGNKLINHVHDGSSRNYQALLVTNVPQGRTVILMTNNKNLSLYDFNTAIQAILDGKPYEQPKKSILTQFSSEFSTMDGGRIVAFYKDLKVRMPNDYNFNNQATLNEIGYFLLNKNLINDAITVFEYNTRLFPSSWNVFDSLGEAYYKKGDKQKSLFNYKRSLELEPTNKGAKAMITELEN